MTHVTILNQLLVDLVLLTDLLTAALSLEAVTNHGAGVREAGTKAASPLWVSDVAHKLFSQDRGRCSESTRGGTAPFIIHGDRCGPLLRRLAETLIRGLVGKEVTNLDERERYKKEQENACADQNNCAGGVNRRTIGKEFLTEWAKARRVYLRFARLYDTQ